MAGQDTPRESNTNETADQEVNAILASLEGSNIDSQELIKTLSENPDLKEIVQLRLENKIGDIVRRDPTGKNLTKSEKVHLETYNKLVLSKENKPLTDVYNILKQCNINGLGSFYTFAHNNLIGTAAKLQSIGGSNVSFNTHPSKTSGETEYSTKFNYTFTNKKSGITYESTLKLDVSDIPFDEKFVNILEEKIPKEIQDTQKNIDKPFSETDKSQILSLNDKLDVITEITIGEDKLLRLDYKDSKNNVIKDSLVYISDIKRDKDFVNNVAKRIIENFKEERTIQKNIPRVKAVLEEIAKKYKGVISELKIINNGHTIEFNYRKDSVGINKPNVQFNIPPELMDDGNKFAACKTLLMEAIQS